MAHRNYYSNPAFSQQSEFYPQKSPIRQPPIGAQDAPLEEQDFYEEMLVDEDGFVKEKKIVVVSNPNADKRNGNERYAIVEQNGSRYAMVPLDFEEPQPKHRYEYIPMSEQDLNRNPRVQEQRFRTPTSSPTRKLENEPKTPTRSPPRRNTSQNFASSQRRPTGRHSTPKRPTDRNNQEIYQLSNGQVHRYAVISVDDDDDLDPPPYYRSEKKLPRTMQKPTKPPPNPIATQKLYELLSTPKKSTPTKPIYNNVPPKAQQRLNYKDQRTTAIVAPMCSNPPPSVYSETTFSNKSESWMNVSGKRPPVHATLTVASLMMILSGGLASALCFYMVSMMGRLYYLDFGIVAGFACLVLGVLGFRARHYYYWLPNRNYMSGYIILTLFSLLTCAGLLVLLFLQPKAGTPLADMTSGAVCGISALSLIFASSGVAASYCCKLPPPDNRVEHCARGFTV